VREIQTLLLRLFLLQAILHLRPAALAQGPKKALWLQLLLNKKDSLIAIHSKICNSVNGTLSKKLTSAKPRFQRGQDN
jgi:hypothetical protein